MTSGRWGVSSIEYVPGHLDFDWTVVQPGFAPAFGDKASFSRAEGSPRMIDVHLEKGWGAMLLVHGPYDRELKSWPAIPGAEVLLDGFSAGRTDSRGRLGVTADSTPTKLSIRYGNWVLSEHGNDVDRDGRINSPWSNIDIKIRPPH